MLITTKRPDRSVDTASRALCISICSEMTEGISRASEELNVPIDIFEGGIFNDGHLVAQDMQERYDAIISQAGTAMSIQPLVHVPLVSVNLTALDFIEAFEKAGSYDKEIMLIGYESELVKELAAMAHVFVPGRFKIITYSSKEEFQAIVSKALSMVEHVIMGFGGCIRDMAEASGIPYILVNSRYDNLRLAVASTKNIIEQNINEKRRARRLQNLINHSREGIISVSEEQAVTICNLTAKRLLKLKNAKVLGSVLTASSAPGSLRELYGDGKFVLNKLEQISGTSFIVSRIPVIVRSRPVETVITFQELSQIQKVEAKARAQLHSRGLVAKYSFSDICRQSDVMNKLVETAKRYASTHAPVLIEGETGTGKELMAQSLHNSSPRNYGPFVAINCAALPEHLLESELFGYEDGAFTGAKKGGKAGVFELAHNGTIFLDEIGEISLNMQGRLLRVLQEKEVFRLGGERVISVDARVVSATNKSLYKLVEEGKFRRDLFFRLNLLPLFIPPLRERPEDLPALIRHFMRRHGASYGIIPPFPCPKAVRNMQTYAWPGNVRELVNIIERLCIIYTDGDDVGELLIRVLSEHKAMQRRSSGLDQMGNSPDAISVEPGTLKEMENAILKTLLERVGGNQTLLADILGISRVSIWKKLKELN